MIDEIDILELERYLFSINYTIPTKQILDLKKVVEEWVSRSNCGAIIYGRPRIGKTRAIKYISDNLRKKFGEELPIYVYNATSHTVTDKVLYSELLKAVGHIDAHKGTASQMKERLINRMIIDAMDTKYRRVVLFIDEAYLLTEKDFIWLIDIYNNLNQSDILFTVFLVGSNELKQLKNVFVRAKKAQIVGRFMVDEFNFKGIQTKADMQICLASLDKPFNIKGYSGDIILSKIFFPLAYSDGYSMTSFIDDIWDAFIEVTAKYNIMDADIPMKFFMDTIINCIKYYGVYEKKIYMPSKSEWEKSIIKAGFVSAESVGTFNNVG
ncbi:ATP-binding protein [Ruminiclostridium papyrosolvens]|uniref:ORC1/DEAH AAA+ ATPase domain-containing protein n=1 Tax=Ruminiclostridium papyrosolvens C7 TaxID=1330534 RepID=U4QZ38_9FIRM|nr:ATP-binding protein [Ruminiclostridium papyrosolvens]EPR10216.1 hypothetical protein L323_14420 [Ruminiclostridium papyrosolvens C7]